MIYLLTSSLLVLAILVLVTAIKQRFRTWILIFIIPYLIFNIGFMYHTVKELWGYPVEAYPKGDVELLAYKIEQPNIIIVVRESSGKSRLHVIPYEEKTEEKIEGAGKNIKKGQRMMMKNLGDNDQESKLEFYSWNPADSMPKENK